jgi:hypothetical protein
MADLARPHDGRSMRATSTAKMGADGKPDPNGQPNPNSNSDNSNVAPGRRKILLDVKGPGVITHIWITFLGPEPHPWAKNGSANHQEMLLRMYWDGNPRPAVEAPVGDFFANSFGNRRGRGLLQLLLAHAIPQVSPDRGRQRERKADQPALL